MGWEEGKHPALHPIRLVHKLLMANRDTSFAPGTSDGTKNGAKKEKCRLRSTSRPQSFRKRTLFLQTTFYLCSTPHGIKPPFSEFLSRFVGLHTKPNDPENVQNAATSNGAGKRGPGWAWERLGAGPGLIPSAFSLG